jgi:hypothetical protein
VAATYYACYVASGRAALAEVAGVAGSIHLNSIVFVRLFCFFLFSYFYFHLSIFSSFLIHPTMFLYFISTYSQIRMFSKMQRT